MKLSPSSPLILLLPTLAAAAATLDPITQPSASAARGSSGIDYRYVDAEPAPYTSKGLQDSPVDGKDGKPHAGPWVETNADRDRKANFAGDSIERTVAKFDPKVPASGHVSTDEGKMMPPSNGGVMDDRNRASPKEGTRGTEGGVSEKGKENQMSGGKTPGSPKEAPPLPPSEKQKLSSDKDAGTGSGSRTADGSANLGMLEVRPAAFQI